MRFKLLCCDVLTRETAHCIARTPHTICPAFTPKGEHNVPNQLRGLLQKQIDEAETDDCVYDAILMAYGLCGNSTAGLEARSFPLVLPRAHDCTTLFLGSKAAFIEHFGDNPSRGWASIGYSERGDELFSDGATRDLTGMIPSYQALVDQYGEENAKYLWDSLHPEAHSEELIFIDLPETRMPTLKERIRKVAEEQGKRLREIPGSLRLIEGLLSGHWPAEDFLVVPPGHRVKAVYDMDEVITSEKIS